MTRTPSPQLLDIDAAPKRRGTTTALVPLAHGICARCDQPLVVIQVTQAALFRHGGYGESKRGTVNICARCGWIGGTSNESTNPRR